MPLISEQYKWSENSAWFQDTSRRAGILVYSPDLSVGDLLESDAGYVWMAVAGVLVYSCYFTPGDPFEVFETQILLREESLSETVGRSIIGGDFNSKSPEWGESGQGVYDQTRSGGLNNRPHDCRASPRLKDRRLVGSREENLE